MERMTAYILSLSRFASLRHFNTTMPRPSPRIVPSAFSSKGFASLVGERARVLLKHIYMKTSLKVSMPPLITMSALPVCNSIVARCMAPKELAHAASTTQLVPPRSREFDIRPATTFPRRPGKEFSCQGTYCSEIRLTILSERASSSPSSLRAFRHLGWPRRAPRVVVNSKAPVTPSMTLTRSLS